ncbi:MAG: calcium-translocating P-type ATPase, PMCA-type [Candidatus Atribacteria bacterium]|nr:calcium-translocating P-type ATPase, PMCA-type [Candidatus Atribacteria bacterium]
MAAQGINWHALSPEEAIDTLQSNVELGLTEEEVKRRTARYGRNVLPEKKPKGILALFLEQFRDFLVLILIGATVVSVLVGETTDALVILAILIINAVLGVVQEKKASCALEALKKMSIPGCEVVRGGVAKRVSSEDLVPGDIVTLREGDFIPADLRLLEARALRVDEASLTGESVAVEKEITALPTETPLPERTNMAYAGTLVTYGRGKGVVVATGKEREIGKIALLLEKEEETLTPLQKHLASLGKLLGLIVIGVCALVFVLGFMREHHLLEMFMTAVSLAVAAIPEGLPAVVTVVLALGVYRMSQHRAIIRKLPAVETLGCTTYICTDKTGTLTENRMQVREVFSFEGETKLLQIAVLCNDAVPGGDGRFLGDPTEIALLEHASTRGISISEIRTRYPREGEIPFDSKRKMMSTWHTVDGRRELLVKGAPDVVLWRCSAYFRNGEIHPLTEQEREQVEKCLEEMALKALRVLAFAFRPYGEDEEEPEQNLIFVGLLGMMDPPREEVKSALREAKNAGITTVMITGDNALTARAIATELDMFAPQDLVVTGMELEKWSQEELQEKIKSVRVFARVWPEQKLRIVEALQSHGEVVAMTGDGVNDAPALKRADIGVAMGVTGTDVAKEVADMVLADDNFATIVEAIREGRVIFENIRKFVLYLLSCNLGEILVVFIPILLGWFRPLVPVQILLINLVTDGLPALALGVDSPEEDLMSRKPRHPKEGIITPLYLRFIFWGALFIALPVIASFWLGLRNWGLETARTMAFLTLGLGELWRAYSFRSERKNFWKIDPRTNLYLVWACLLSVLVLVLTVLLPPLGRIFGCVSLTLPQWMWTVGFSILSLSFYEIRKIILWRRDGNGTASCGSEES